jgi:peptide/nickel transport system permease protein
MKEYIIRRILYSILILMGTVVLTFIMVRLMPGDPIRAAMQQNVDMSDESIVEEVRAQHGLDRPAHVQFTIWLSSLCQRRLGQVALQR